MSWLLEFLSLMFLVTASISLVDPLREGLQGKTKEWNNGRLPMLISKDSSTTIEASTSSSALAKVTSTLSPEDTFSLIATTKSTSTKERTSNTVERTTSTSASSSSEFIAISSTTDAKSSLATFADRPVSSVPTPNGIPNTTPNKDSSILKLSNTNPGTTSKFTSTASSEEAGTIVKTSQSTTPKETTKSSTESASSSTSSSSSTTTSTTTAATITITARNKLIRGASRTQNAIGVSYIQPTNSEGSTTAETSTSAAQFTSLEQTSISEPKSEGLKEMETKDEEQEQENGEASMFFMYIFFGMMCVALSAFVVVLLLIRQRLQKQRNLSYAPVPDRGSVDGRPRSGNFMSQKNEGAIGNQIALKKLSLIEIGIEEPERKREDTQNGILVVQSISLAPEPVSPAATANANGIAGELRVDVGPSGPVDKTNLRNRISSPATPNDTVQASPAVGPNQLIVTVQIEPVQFEKINTGKADAGSEIKSATNETSPTVSFGEECKEALTDVDGAPKNSEGLTGAEPQTESFDTIGANKPEKSGSIKEGGQDTPTSTTEISKTASTLAEIAESSTSVVLAESIHTF